ncbi:biotin transporter BioY [Phenylobacterium sp.]|uniref:biotin transporter BioY n=1 Tax=Phenylobacterium sp. TaxID=1871053 RepID=UPI002810C1AF|nr:biotin transporter BioY [Phenylobacterium sp.]
MAAALPLSLATASFTTRMAAVVAGAAVMAAASQAAIPAPVAPITLQTFALFVLAGVLGGSLTLRAVLIWLAAAAIGLPVLAEGAGGPDALFGPTQGYLFGMAVAGALAGYACQRRGGFAAHVVIFLLGHALVLAMGFIGLLDRMDAASALAGGVLPFLPGAAVKSLAAAGALRLVALALKSRAEVRAGP